MKYYPIFLRVEGRRCLVIGGGEIAARKVATLADAGADLTVISPTLCPALAAQAAAGRVVHHARPFERGDLRRFWLVVAATDDDELQTAIAREAEREGVLLNVVDRPQLCSFIVPAVVEQGDLTIAVSTNGASPALARRIREQLEETFGREYGDALAILGAVREHLRRDVRTPAERRRILTALARSDLLEQLRAGDSAAVDDLLRTAIGGDASIATLGIALD